nr:putative integron gene cassette protein [uncultured bacterium]
MIAFFSKAIKVKFDRFLHRLFYFFARCSSSNATWEVWRKCRKSRVGFFNHDQIFHLFIPACLNILFNVPGAKSSFCFPATVTRPGFSKCLNCL